MSVQVKVTNNCGAIAAHLREAADAHAEKTARRIEAGWKDRAPVKTGHYRRSITTEKDGDGWVVYSPVEYAVYLEYGTRYMSPRPSMNPAVDAVRGDWEQGLRELFGDG